MPEAGAGQQASTTRQLIDGATARHRLHAPVQREGRSQVEDAIHSIVSAEKEGFDFVRCYDATDYMIPQVANSPDITDVAVGADDWNAAFSMEPIITAAAAQTSSIRFFWGPIDAVRRAPVNIAQMLLTLDHVTAGRTVLVMAHGQANHMRQFGMARAGTKDKFWDAVQIVRKLTRSSDEFSYQGRVWQMDRASLVLPPADSEHPPLIYLAGGASESLELTGRFADGWYHRPPGMDDGEPEIFAARVQEIRRHAEEAGRDPDSVGIQLGVSVIMTEDEASISELIRHPISLWFAGVMLPLNTASFRKWGLPHPYGFDYNYHRDSIPEWVGRHEFLDVTSRVPVESVSRILFIGTADEVFGQLEPYLTYGVTEVAMNNYASHCGTKFWDGAAAADARFSHLVRSRTVSPWPKEWRRPEE